MAALLVLKALQSRHLSPLQEHRCLPIEKNIEKSYQLKGWKLV